NSSNFKQSTSIFPLFNIALEAKIVSGDIIVEFSDSYLRMLLTSQVCTNFNVSASKKDMSLKVKPSLKYSYEIAFPLFQILPYEIPVSKSYVSRKKTVSHRPIKFKLS